MKQFSASETAMVFAMGAVIFFCRAFPFVFLNGKKESSGKKYELISFAERIVPPLAMTVLAFNALGPYLIDLGKYLFLFSKSSQTEKDFFVSLSALFAASFTAVFQIWKRNALISIFGGTLIFMILQKLFS